jgi:succinate dehydrogenase hydrophobic anchor subunit
MVSLIEGSRCGRRPFWKQRCSAVLATFHVCWHVIKPSDQDLPKRHSHRKSWSFWFVCLQYIS